MMEENPRKPFRNLHAENISSLDAGDLNNWASIIKEARAGGVTKQDFCEKLSCVWSTVVRWEDGVTAPGIHSRQMIKSRLITMLETRPAL
ncbi:MAG TPA: hypothetical protein VIG74_04620 [Alphaproteobacteria bacterium]|jgi:DNA-binding transcriptional regulator YiaG